MEIKPIRYRFYDLQLPHPRVKATEKHEAKIITGRIGDELLRKIEVCKARTPFVIHSIKLDLQGGVRATKILGDAPIEKRTDAEHVALGRTRSDSCASGLVKGFALQRGHFRGWNIADALGKFPQDVTFRLGARLAEAISGEFVLEETLDLSCQSSRRLQLRPIENLLRTLDCLGIIAGFKRHMAPPAIHLFGEPENVPAEVNPAHLASALEHR